MAISREIFCSRRAPALRFVPERPSGREVLELAGISKSYGDNHVLAKGLLLAAAVYAGAWAAARQPRWLLAAALAGVAGVEVWPSSGGDVTIGSQSSGGWGRFLFTLAAIGLLLAIGRRAGGGVERNVTVAIGHGKKAARHIDAWLHGESAVVPPKHALASFERLNTWYYADAPKTVRPMLDIIRRRSSFDEVQGGLDEGNALYEARRCLSCGNCFECDNCYAACPEDAIAKLGPGKRYRYDYARCTGCSVCFEQCPCHAIEMISEPA